MVTHCHRIGCLPSGKIYLREGESLGLAVLIIGHLGNFWTKAPGKGTKYLSFPGLSQAAFSVWLYLVKFT